MRALSNVQQLTHALLLLLLALLLALLMVVPIVTVRVKDNYVTDWWEKYVYHRGRSPIPINSYDTHIHSPWQPNTNGPLTLLLPQHDALAGTTTSWTLLMVYQQQAKVRCSCAANKPCVLGD